MNWRNLNKHRQGVVGTKATATSRQARQENLKRAVSTAYYAMFHALCRSNADTLADGQISPISRLSWTRNYRALEHRQAKNRLLQIEQDLPAPARQFTTAFALLQSRREAADYNPHRSFTRAEAATLLNSAENAIQEYMQMPRNERRAIASLMLMQERITA